MFLVTNIVFYLIGLDAMFVLQKRKIIHKFIFQIYLVLGGIICILYLVALKVDNLLLTNSIRIACFLLSVTLIYALYRRIRFRKKLKEKM
jgi:hypothetical protein